MPTTICATLGYQDDDQEPTLEPGRAAIAQTILASLATIDQAIQANTLDSMAVKVGDLEVNYGANLNQLKLEGSRLLNQLSQLTQLALVYDRYTGRVNPYGDRANQRMAYGISNINPRGNGNLNSLNIRSVT